MVIVSHDREFLDQLCNKLVETEHGVASTYKGNYTEYVKAKEERAGQQWAAWEKQQKEISRQVTAVPHTLLHVMPDDHLLGSELCFCNCNTTCFCNYNTTIVVMMLVLSTYCSMRRLGQGHICTGL